MSCSGLLRYKNRSIWCPLSDTCLERDGVSTLAPYNTEKRSCSIYKSTIPSNYRCKKIRIKGRRVYNIIIDPKNRIISTRPHLDSLMYKNFTDIFSKHKHDVKFFFMGDVEYPNIVDEDKLDGCVEKNDSMKVLINKFDLVF